MKNGFPAPNKELAKTKNNHLTGKAPYKFESTSLQRRVKCEPDFLDQVQHAPRGFFPLLNGGELAIVYCFVFLYFWVSGGGEWSLDRLRASASISAASPSRV
jgi:hypothetical protein